MVLPCTCDGPSVYLAVALSPARHRSRAATRFPPGRTDVPLVCLPCTSGVTAVYPGWRAGLRAGLPGSHLAAARRPAADRFLCPQPGLRPVTAGPPAASPDSDGTGCSRSPIRVPGQVTP